MKSSFSLINPGLARWGNFNHTQLVKAELFRASGGDKVVSKSVEGIVRSSEDLSPLSGVSVRLNGTTLEAQTDINGWFSIVVENPVVTDALIFTQAGYYTAHVSVTNEDFLHINLSIHVEIDVRNLAEPVTTKDLFTRIKHSL